MSREKEIKEKIYQASSELLIHTCLLVTAHFEGDTEDAKRHIEHINFLNFTIRDLDKELDPAL